MRFFVSKILINDATTDTTNDTIKNRQNEIVGLIKKVPSITRKEIAQTLNISELTVAQDLKLLQEIGAIKRNVSNKTGYWKILERGFLYKKTDNFFLTEMCSINDNKGVKRDGRR